MGDGELWHLVEARREDGSPTIFRIRELDARLELPRIFVVELPYPISALSRLPDAASYRRFATFEEQWLDPACHALGCVRVAVKIEEGSFFVYLYGDADPKQLIARLSPFDGALGFFDEADPTWDEYAALRELLDEAKAMPSRAPADEAPVRQVDDAVVAAAIEHTKTTTPIRPLARRGATIGPKTKAKAKPKARPKAKRATVRRPAKPAKR